MKMIDITTTLIGFLLGGVISTLLFGLEFRTVAIMAIGSVGLYISIVANYYWARWREGNRTIFPDQM